MRTVRSDRKTARHVSEGQALDHVFGYTICWDFSQRDPWGRGRQNTRNIRKGFDTSPASDRGS